MAQDQNMLKLKGEWVRIHIDGDQDVRFLHLLPRFYNTAFCGFEVEAAASGRPFRRQRPGPSDPTPRCAGCVRAAASSAFNRADAK